MQNIVLFLPHSCYIHRSIKTASRSLVGHNDTLRISKTLFIKHQLNAIVRLAIELSRRNRLLKARPIF